MFSDDIDLHYLGALNVQHWSIAMQRLLAFRARQHTDRFYDIDFTAMQHDPIGALRELYAWLDEPVTETFEAGVRAWWTRHAEQREANIHPEPEAFGLDLDEVRSSFAEYTSLARMWTQSRASARQADVHD
jgi:hypothetical protein